MSLQKHDEELLSFREMVEHANDGMLLVEDEIIIECNPAACRLYGLSRDELVGLHPGTLSPEYQKNGRKSIEYSRELMADAMAGRARHFLWQHLRSDGTVFTAEISLNPAKTVRLSEGKEVKRYVSVFRDVTRSIEAERALEESEQRFRRLFELAPVALALLSLDGRIVDHNRWHRNLFGYTLDELPDLDHWWPLAYPDPEDRDRAKTMWEAGIRRIREKGGELRPTELWVATKSGERRNLIFGGAMIGSEIVVSFYDVTEERRVQAELERLNAELEDRVRERTRELADALSTLELTHEELIRSEKLAGLGALVAGVAHELNTPIGNALMVASTMRDMGPRFNEFLAEGLKRSELDRFLQDLQESSEIMERNLLRAAEMIKSFKQVAVDQSSHQRRPFMLTEIANELQLTLSPLFKRSTVSLTLDVDPEIRMNSYPGPLSQVLMNLVNNALVHAFEDSPEGEIRFSAHMGTDGYVKLVVVDNGCGIEPEVLPQIFDPFFTTKLGKGGSGLGLHIVYSLVTGILGGSIRVISEPGQGTSVNISLPVTAPDEA
ncbi:PAS domain S-box protein [Marispirochaeta aestuarii]|uniref:PAS domain-containing sensor histidine kinase n=1 Tax=Marispirochaeta aestuarii TaxID=1963862 RepID=UPI0029C7C4C5|nr:PAS domain S-box protein [Marispirochaeta aestuarii]